MYMESSFKFVSLKALRGIKRELFEALEVRQYKKLRETQLKVYSAIDKEESLSTVGSDCLCDEICRALTASHVNVFTEAVIGHIHLA